MRIKLQFKKSDELIDIPDENIIGMSNKEIDEYIILNYYQKFIKKNAKVTHKPTYEGLVVQCNCVNEEFCLKDKEECHHFEPHICDDNCKLTCCYDKNFKKHYGIKCLPVK